MLLKVIRFSDNFMVDIGRFYLNMTYLYVIFSMDLFYIFHICMETPGFTAVMATLIAIDTGGQDILTFR